jgi:hypothetical protein
MHAAHADPRRILIAAIAALVLALAAMALVSSLGNLNLSTASDPAPVSAQPSAPALRTTAPAWLVDPVASPLGELQVPASTPR